MSVWEDLVQKIIKNNPGLALVVILILGFFIVITGTATVINSGKTIVNFFQDVFTPQPIKNYSMTNSSLRDKTLQLCRELTDFINQRQKDEPQILWNDFQNSSNALSRYSTETINLYYGNYGPQALAYFSEFQKRNMINDSFFEEEVKAPTNYLGMRDVAIKLGALAYQLK
jgi:hypothetical protein